MQHVGSFYSNILIILIFFFSSLLLFGCITPLKNRPREIVPTPTVGRAPLASLPNPWPQATVGLTSSMATMTPASLATGTRSLCTATVRPAQLHGEYLPNPYMGWQDTQPAQKRFVETVAYRRFNWDILNPAEGSYVWDAIELLRPDKVSLGKTISFRVRTAQPPPWGEGQVMPAWLIERGAVIAEGGSGITGVRSTEPYYPGCLFLEAHGRFIEALRQHYDGDLGVAFIDIGSYGTYGEWESEQYNSHHGSLDWHARRRILDMYLGGRGTRPCLDINGQVVEVSYNYPGFQHTQLVMPYTPGFTDSLIYARGRRQDMGIRHDALGSEKHQQKYRQQIKDLVQLTWPRAPIIFEFAFEAYSPAELISARNFVQEMHATLVHDNLNGQGNDELIKELLVPMGYRITLREMTYTSDLRPGDRLSFEMTWENTGLAPPYFKTYPLVVSLTNPQGRAVVEQQLNPDIRHWMPGKLVSLPGTLLLPVDLPGGVYDIRVAFVDPVSRQPILNLAFAGRDKQGRYLIGPVNVLP